MPKRTLRAEALARRKGLTSLQALSLSLCIQERFKALPEFLNADTVALYAPIHNEVETSLVAEECLRRGKILLFPAVARETLEFRQVHMLDQLTPGSFGILEPQGPCCAPADTDLIIVPGVAFDCSGRRLGYGKGYYDRSLHRLEGSGRLIGFCYDFQLVQEIVGEPHDVTMDLIVTESRVVRVNKNIGQGVHDSEN